MEFVVHVSNRVLKKGEQFFGRTIKKSKMINQFGFFNKLYPSLQDFTLCQEQSNDEYQDKDGFHFIK